MLKKLKSMFRSRTPPAENPVRVIGRFDAAQTTRDNIRHWAMADYLSADQEANPEIRKTLRMRSRYEVANNSYAKGLVQMLANDTIGTGPRIQLLTENERYNDEIEREFAGCGYGKFKPAVGEAVIETLRPIREETQRLLKDKAYLESVYRDGAQKASYVAEKTLRKVYKKVGFLAR